MSVSTPTPSLPAVTIVISFRERWRFTALTVASILRHTPVPFALWLLDPGLPDAVRGELQPYLDAGQLELVPVPPGEHPNHWREQIAPRLASPFAVFIDNDVVVTPGWLEAMLACAAETGAGIVCPLYLWGDGEQSEVIHMAGGDLNLTPTEAGMVMTESHRHVGRSIAEVPEDLHRRPCGFGEYHCLLMRRDVYSAAGVFGAGIATVHEHIHASMLALELGFETWFEPAARVNYLAFAPWQVGELPEFRARWDVAAAEDSLTRFAERWGVIDDDAYRLPIRQFLAGHAGHSDVIDPRPGLGAARGQAMARTDLEQTYAGIEWRAGERGYDDADIRQLRTAYRLGLSLSAGLYRPCGRPFVNHLAGTASVLLFYGCPIPLVLASLLHAAHSHGPAAFSRTALARFARSSPQAKSAVRLAMLYADRTRRLEAVDLEGGAMPQLPVDLAAVFVLDAANEVDMHLSREVAVSGRTDVLAGERLSNCRTVLEQVGLPGLAATLDGLGEEVGARPAVPFQDGLTISFRIGTAQTGTAPAPKDRPAPAGQAPRLAERIDGHA